MAYNSMPSLFFSVIIPTRERAKYLKYAVEGCLAQDFSDFEVIVADNCSSAATSDTVGQFSDSRIRYLRSDEPLAMSENWERAVRHAQGEYITVLGDDDVLLSHALSDVAALIRDTHAQALRWSLAYYRWPDVDVNLGPNLFVIPLQTGSDWQEGLSTIQDVTNGIRHYSELPSLYNSFVHREVLSTIRATTGRVFSSMTPDIYSGFAIAAVAPRYISMLRPASVAGTCARSNGEGVMRSGAKSDVALEFAELNERFGFHWHAAAPHLPGSLPAIILECFEQAKERFPRLARARLDRKAVIRMILAERARAGAYDAKVDAVACLRRWTQGDGPLSRWLDSHWEDLSLLKGAESVTFKVPQKGLQGTTLALDASEFGAFDTVAIAELFERLFNARQHRSASPRPTNPWKAAVGSLLPPRLLQEWCRLSAKIDSWRQNTG